MDPVTAIFNAIGAFFQFASTPAGQTLLGDIRSLNQNVASDVAGLLNVMNKHAQSMPSK